MGVGRGDCRKGRGPQRINPLHLIIANEMELIITSTLHGFASFQQGGIFKRRWVFNKGFLCGQAVLYCIWLAGSPGLIHTG